MDIYQKPGSDYVPYALSAIELDRVSLSATDDLIVNFASSSIITTKLYLSGKLPTGITKLATGSDVIELDMN